MEGLHATIFRIELSPRGVLSRPRPGNQTLLTSKTGELTVCVKRVRIGPAEVGFMRSKDSPRETRDRDAVGEVIEAVRQSFGLAAFKSL